MKKLSIICFSLLTALAAFAENWTIVTDVDSLEAGDRIVLACNTNGKTAGAFDSSKGALTAVNSTFSSTNDAITSLGTGTIVLILGGQAGAWTFETEGKLLGAAAAKKLLLGAGTTTWNISIFSGNATITNTTATNGSIVFNATSPRFCNYTTAQTAVQIYKSDAPLVKYELTYQGYPYRRTMCEIPSYYPGARVALSTFRPHEPTRWFLGWQYDGVTYQPGEIFTMPENDVELVPQFLEIGEGICNPVSDEGNAEKILRDGQLLIIRGDRTYNAQGVLIK